MMKICKGYNPICDGNFWLGENSMIHFSRHLRYAPSYNQPWKRCSPRTIQDWFYLFDIKELSFSTYHIHTMSPKMTPLQGVSEKIPERRPMLDKDPKTYCQSAPVHSIFHIPYLPSLAHKINSFALLSCPIMLGKHSAKERPSWSPEHNRYPFTNGMCYTHGIACSITNHSNTLDVV